MSCSLYSDVQSYQNAPPVKSSKLTSPVCHLLNVNLSNGSAVPLLRIYPRVLKACPHKTCTIMFKHTLFIKARRESNPNAYLMSRQIKMVQLQNRILFSHKKNKVVFHTLTCMNFGSITLTKQKATYYMCLLLDIGNGSGALLLYEQS